MVKIESSYCFEESEEGDDKKPDPYPLETPSSETLKVPKKKTNYLFESNGSIWKSITPRNLLRSTVDLLN